MATWPFWILFLASGVLALVVVKRLDDLEHRAREHRRDSERPSSSSRPPPRQKQT